MSVKAEGDLARQYRQVLARYPRRQASLAGGQPWAWIEAGAGETTLLMLPGLMGEAETSFLYLEALAARMRVVAVSHPPSVEQVGRLCDGLCALLDHLAIPQAVVLGGSSGGFLAQAFARRAPARTRGLILTHTGLPEPARARTARRYLWLLRALPFGVTRALMWLSAAAFFPRRSAPHAFWRAHFRAITGSLSREALINRFRLLDDFHSHYRFRAGELPIAPQHVLLMEMQRDSLTSPAEQSAMRAIYHGAQIQRFAETAHFDSVEKPQAQIHAIAQFVESRNSS